MSTVPSPSTSKLPGHHERRIGSVASMSRVLPQAGSGQPDQAFCFLSTMFWAMEVFSPSAGMITHAAR